MSHSSSSDKTDYEFRWKNPKEIKRKWESFAKFGHTSAQAPKIVEMTGKNFDKWLKDAEVIDGKLITTTMTGIVRKSELFAFSKVTGYSFELKKKVSLKRKRRST
ncbi:hypothetical protein Mgra_00008586, partial [Meloidogyne graminicola]